MKRFDAEPILASLKDFQRDTVEHVMNRLYRDPRPSRRFLVADETGLGKSVVARGVIARTIEELQDDDSVGRIDVVYVCSNSDIAEQNLKRLNVTGQDHLPFTSRLTLLAKESGRLAAATAAAGKPVNLVSFTPGTSFDMGWQTGKAEERAMLHVLLTDALDLRGRAEKSSRMLLQGNVHRLETFTNTVDRLLYELVGPIDPTISIAFKSECRRLGYLVEFQGLVDELGRRQSVPPELKQRASDLIRRLRSLLARVSVETLEPDLVILDEFQRFRHLLDREGGGEAAELAHSLFDYGKARVLLLSATPYKPYTLAEEGIDGDDHFTDFIRTLEFLGEGSPLNLDEVRQELSEYRSALINGGDGREAATRLRDQLLLVMTRTERPQLGKNGMFAERSLEATPVESADLVGFAALRRVAAAVSSAAPLEYWKSIPHFANFMDGYMLGNAVRRSLRSADSELGSLLGQTQHVDRSSVERFRAIDLGNGRLRALAADTVGRGWWKLLWVPPSMPYLVPAGPFAEPGSAGMTKRLIFSSWAAAPTAIAALLSYDAERRIVEGGRLTSNTPEARRVIAKRLMYRVRQGAPGAMSTLALFWPHPALAAIGDPLEIARRFGSEVTADEAAASVADALMTAAASSEGLVSDETESWGGYFAWPGGLPSSSPSPARIVDALVGEDQSDQDGDDSESRAGGLRAHVDAALGAARRSGLPQVGNPEAVAALTAVALHSPANIAYRALARVLGDHHGVTDAGHWEAAASLAAGMRSLFNRTESTFLLDKLYGAEEPYWRVVLRYCAHGNLQAVMDEYLHHLRSAESNVVMNDETLMSLAQQAREALTMRPSRFQAFDPDRHDDDIAFIGRFALRYGARGQDQESARQPQVRHAFNSPFWPFVLASTSVGQEGIDFHWWCHCVVHWNLPANPVDFEQREGRVNRFGGHAVRRNVAERHHDDVMASREIDPWKAAYDAARGQHPELSDFAPYWVYPGTWKVERQLINYPLSRDMAKAQALLDDLAMYRLAFGQPRQEDLLDLLERRGVRAGDVTGLDLRPPADLRDGERGSR